MALLVFHNDDPAPEVMTGPLAELLAVRAATPAGPGAETGERAEDLCQWIDIDAELFARSRRTSDDAALADARPRRTARRLAVVVANRLPRRAA